MVYVFGSLAAFLVLMSVLYWRGGDKGMGIWLLFCAMFNAGAAVKVVVTHDDHAYRLHARDEAPDDPDWGMPDRR